MFLAIQFPFADARGFLDDKGHRLLRPAWPVALPGRDFVRSSGLVKPRRRGGVAEWAGEEIYCDARRALRFQDQLGKKEISFGHTSGTLRCAFRRFHSEGTVARLELGLRFDSVEVPDTSAQLLKLAREVLLLPVRVADEASKSSATKTMYLVDAGNQLANHFLLATTDRKHVSLVSNREDWWFSYGNLGVVIEYQDELVFPPHTRYVLQVPDAGATLFHTWLDVGKQRCSVWFIKEGDRRDKEAARRLRIHLIRLHAERECLRTMLLNIRDGNRFKIEKGGPVSDELQRYLRDTVNLLQRPTFMGVQQSAMLGIAREALGVAFEGETASLELMRRQVSSLVDGYVRRAQNTATVINNIQGDVMNTNIQMGPVTVTGDFNVVTATNIQNSFNKAANAEVSADLKEKLKALAVQVATLAKELPQEDAEKASKYLEVLTSEAVSKKPRKEWYELSAKGLLDAAKTVAKMIGPIGVAVKAVLALIA
jgi:hypothetical protein